MTSAKKQQVVAPEGETAVPKIVGQRELDTRIVTLEGRRPLLLNRYPGSNKIKLSPEEKMYFDSDGKTLVIPALNIMSFLASLNTFSCVKLLSDIKDRAKQSHLVGSFVSIKEMLIPLLRNGKPIVFEGFGKNGITVLDIPARLKIGVRSNEPLLRPCIDLPWTLRFTVSIMPNNWGIDWQTIGRYFEEGGWAVGLGSFNTIFGKFDATFEKI